MTNNALLMEILICAECVRLTTRLRELCGLVVCASSPNCYHTLIGQHDMGSRQWLSVQWRLFAYTAAA